MRIRLAPETEIMLLRWLRQGYIETDDLPATGDERSEIPRPAALSKTALTTPGMTVNDVAALVAWLEGRKEVNVTVLIQSVGNITNSHVAGVNVMTRAD